MMSDISFGCHGSKAKSFKSKYYPDTPLDEIPCNELNAYLWAKEYGLESMTLPSRITGSRPSAGMFSDDHGYVEETVYRKHAKNNPTDEDIFAFIAALQLQGCFQTLPLDKWQVRDDK